MSKFEEDKYMAIVNATDQTFTTDTSEGVVLVDFWAPWCGPCKMIAPVLQELDTEIGESAKIVKVDVDENQETAGKFGVMSIPTLIVLKDGEVVDKVVGFQPKEALAELIAKHA
ncbi:thioredoxin [Peribacillus sp. NPDC096540]|uniref:thioredoxin n=1 Tax=Peribacillus sp. NPDC096540 TaxID=3390612 RepID=UPI003CFD4C0F